MAQSTAHRRLLQEYRALTNNPPDGITAGPVSEDDLLHWQAWIQGPEGTPFEGGIFPAELRFPKDYPLAPPTMKFLDEVWHPNGKCPSSIILHHSRSFCNAVAGALDHARQMSDRIASVPERLGLHLYPAPSRR